MDRQGRTDLDSEKNKVGIGRRNPTVRRSDVRNMIDQAKDEMVLRIHDTAEKAVVDFMKTVDGAHNKRFMKNALRRAMVAYG